MGEYVFVIGKNLEVEGFKKGRDYWYTTKREAFCFQVKRVEGKTKKACVEEAPILLPEVSVKEEEEFLVLAGEEGKLYRVYPYSGDHPEPFALQEFKGRGKLKKRYAPYSVALTEVLNGTESSPLVLFVPPKKPPSPPPPEGLSYLLHDGKIVFYWFHPEPERIVGFRLYLNGKPLNEKPLFVFTYELPLTSGRLTFGVSAVNSFGVESKVITKTFDPSELPRP